ncbi:enoyl-CoA hydratase [Actinospongicola halichondriae]|uniref:enoyl-CoA hydratase n=1 Tax=Actinospongicola halichondriae TaxID=3236844 RepID=UPI003D47012F
MTYIRTEITDGVAVITLNDPDRRNALNLDMNVEIVDALDTIEADESVGAVVVTGEPPAFCAGADLSQLGASKEDGLKKIYEGFLRFGSCPLPTIAAVNGAAVGAGSNLALVCDVRIAAERARFDSRFLQLGIHPGGGHTWMFRRITGPQAVVASVLLGEIMDGREAERVGLAYKCVPDDELLDTAIAMGRKAAEAPRELLMKTKASILAMADIDLHADAVDRELEPQVWSMEQPAFKEKLAALQKKISSK